MFPDIELNIYFGKKKIPKLLGVFFFLKTAEPNVKSSNLQSMLQT